MSYTSETSQYPIDPPLPSPSSQSSEINTSQQMVNNHLEHIFKKKQYCSTTRDFLAHFGSLPPSVDYRTVLEEAHPSLLQNPFEAKQDLEYRDEQGEVRSWPTTGVAKEYYTPLAQLLMGIQNSLHKINQDSNSLTFFAYGHTMEGEIDETSALKPAVLATHGGNSNNVAWRVVEVTISVASEDQKRSLQCSSYAKAMFLSRPGRRYAPILTFNPGSNQVQFNICNRSGVSSSLPLDISKVGGFRGFVRIMVGLLCSMQSAQDVSQDSKFVMLPGCLVKVEEVISERSSVVGRGTRVVRGSVVKTVDGDQDSVEFNETPGDEGDSESKGSQTSSALHSLVLSQYRLFHSTPLLKQSTLQVGETVIVKDHWPEAQKASVEMTSLNECRGLFGVPTLRMGFHVLGVNRDEVLFSPKGCVSEEMAESLLRREAEEALEDLKGGGTSASRLAVDELGAELGLAPRQHMRLVYSTIGVSLLQAKTPAELLEAVVHALIGHWNYFRSGWLHRDVSMGNVLLLPDGEPGRPPLELSPDFKCLKMCKGAMIDTDFSVRREDNKPQLETCGTFMFTSRHLLEARSDEEPTIHTAYDDVESLAWVLLRTIIEKAKKAGAVTHLERHWTDGIDCDGNSRDRYVKKSYMAVEIQNRRKLKTGYSTPFLGLLGFWLDLCGRYDWRETEKGPGIFNERTREEEDEELRVGLYLPIVEKAMMMLREDKELLKEWPCKEIE